MNNTFQERHHGISIPKRLQPKCPKCKGYMSLHIMSVNDEETAFWFCLKGTVSQECDGEVGFAEWYDRLPGGVVKKHFNVVGIPPSVRLAEELTEDGYTKVGGHIWGGGTWGVLEGRKAWTGYKGQTLEYWQKKD